MSTPLVGSVHTMRVSVVVVSWTVWRALVGVSDLVVSEIHLLCIFSFPEACDLGGLRIARGPAVLPAC